MKLPYLFLILFLFSCQTKEQKPEEKTQANLESFQNYKTIKREKAPEPVIRTYITDSAYLDYDYQTKLKNGYRIEHRVFTESDFNDTLQTIFLMKASIEIKDLNGGSSYGLPHKNIGYIGADFENCFVFVQSFGSGNPHVFQLVEKSTGTELKRGTWVDVNEKEDILLYIADLYEDNEQLKLLNTKTNNEKIIPQVNNIECTHIGGLRNCVAIDSLSKDFIWLAWVNGDDEVIVKYNRP